MSVGLAIREVASGLFTVRLPRWVLAVLDWWGNMEVTSLFSGSARPTLAGLFRLRAQRTRLYRALSVPKNIGPCGIKLGTLVERCALLSERLSSSPTRGAITGRMATGGRNCSTNRPRIQTRGSMRELLGEASAAMGV